MDISILMGAGLSEREAKVFVALLELGLTTTGPISERTRLPTSKLYSILNKLIDRGLAAYVLKAKTKYFHALNPDNLLSYLFEKERKLKEILPELKQKQQFSDSPQLSEIYEGFNAIRSMNEELLSNLKQGGFYYAFTFEETYLDSDFAQTYLHQLHKKLSDKKIEDRLIAPLSMNKVIRKLYADIPNIKIKFTNTHFPRGLVITNSAIINSVWGERPTAVKITSEQISKKYKEFFEEMWKIAKK